MHRNKKPLRGKVLNLVNGLASMKASGVSMNGAIQFEGFTREEMEQIRQHLDTTKTSSRCEQLDHDEGTIYFMRED